MFSSSWDLWEKKIKENSTGFVRRDPVIKVVGIEMCGYARKILE